MANDGFDPTSLLLGGAWFPSKRTIRWIRPLCPHRCSCLWMTGALKQRDACRFFFLFTSVVLTNYLLTDHDAAK